MIQRGASSCYRFHSQINPHTLYIAHTQQYNIIELPSQKPFEPANNAVTSLNVTKAQRGREI